MIIIADSGSTKTDWLILGNDKSSKITTEGINPFYQEREDIVKIINSSSELTNANVEAVYFYGAGCAFPDKNKIVEESIKFTINTKAITIASDLQAAAHSLLGNKSGIACIMGTGSNSCQYNGTEITHNVSPLGYILGDEGSGAVIGKSFIADYLKNQLPQDISNKFTSETGLNTSEILTKVYKQPFPNRYLASFTKFIKTNIGNKYLYELVKDSFISFFKRNIEQYSEYKNQEIHFTGSIAYHFEDILIEAALETGVKISSITQSPMEGLKLYHSEKHHTKQQTT